MISSAMKRLSACAAILLASACSDGSDGSPDSGADDTSSDSGALVDCATTTCGTNASCDASTGAAICSCDEGFQDEDEDGDCTVDCATTTCGTDATCDETTGTATCSCDEGFQDEDEDGDCTVDCASTTCGTDATCDETTGTATCSCDEGFDDLDGDGDCTAECSITEQSLPIHEDGTDFGADFPSNLLWSDGAGCGTGAGAEVVYELDLQAGDILRAAENTSSFDGVIRLVRACLPGNECLESVDFGDSFVHTIGETGTYYVIIESYGDANGDAYDFDIELVTLT